MITKKVIIEKKDFNKGNYKEFLLVGDVGGTHCTLSVVGAKKLKEFVIIFSNIYSTVALSDVSPKINEVLRQAQEDYDIDISIACLSAAGHVTNNRQLVKLTNAGLKIDVREIISQTVLTTAVLLNDFEAIAYGIDILDIKNDVIKLSQTTEFDTAGTLAVIGPGTGLGMALLPYHASHDIHVPIASEGGHISFMPTNDLEWELFKQLRSKAEADPDMEYVVSGKGMQNIYEFLRNRQQFPETSITKNIDSLYGDDRLREIERSYAVDSTCKKTIDMFMIFYARAAKSLALTTTCTNGLFLWGSITHKILDFMKTGIFMQEFQSHTLKSDLLKRVPVYIITNMDTPLYGCANFGLNFH